MQLADRVKQDLTVAMKAGEKERVSALRLVLSELQKSAKEGDGDELAVMRRERKRRHESAAAFRAGGRPELAEAEEAEAQVIEAYLPAELSDDELRAIVADAVAETGASSPRDMGHVMKAAMARVAGRADGKRVSTLAQEVLNG
ncbi:MAG TPA: GatB/YqeY domain-containing protein [Solirubrobacteraceae bacterium]